MPKSSSDLEHTPEGKIVLRVAPSSDEAPDLSEYRYVIDDLKRVAAVAAAMFALLIALSFLFR
jgi:hypothetical protein